jgi:hypothetical protein
MTRSNQDRPLAQALFAARLNFFLPLHRNRGSRAIVPLFSNYLFFYGTVDQTYQLYDIGRKRICQSIPQPWIHQRTLYEELEVIRQGMKLDQDLQAVPLPPLLPGSPANLLIAGQEIQVRVERQKGNRVYLPLPLLGQMVELNVPRELLQ